MEDKKNSLVKDLADKSYATEKEFLDLMLEIKTSQSATPKDLFNLIAKLYFYLEASNAHRNLVNSNYVDLYNHHCHNIALKMLDTEWRSKANKFRNEG